MNTNVKTTIVYSVYTLALIKALSTASLTWLSCVSLLSVAATVVKGHPVQLYRKRSLAIEEALAIVAAEREELEHNRQELASQSEALQEYEWQQREKLASLEAERQQLQLEVSSYTEQLKLSATEQVRGLVEDYESKLVIEHDRRLLLESELEHYKAVIEQLQAPRLPTASDPASLLATALCNQLNQLGTPVDFERVWYDNGDIIAWIKPRKGGVKAVSKHVDSIHLGLSLTRKPLVTVINGFVEVAMRPAPYSDEAPDTSLYIKGQHNVTAHNTTEAMRQHLTNAWSKSPPAILAGFIEPVINISPRGGISDLERNWILDSHFKGRDKKATIYRVYGINSGRSAAYGAASERYDEVMQEIANGYGEE